MIGIDGGGTGAKGITADLEGTPLRHFQGGATNYNGNKKNVIDQNIAELLHQAREQLDIADCRAICIGSAGMSGRRNREWMEEAVAKAGFTAPCLLVPDSVTAHAGALNNHPGIILIAGTGAICFGRNEAGETIRTGGRGHLIDDEGSAYAIAKNILNAVVRAEDGRRTPTVLTDMVFSKLGIHSAEELTEWIYGLERTKKEIAALAVILEEALAQEDMAAEEILEKAVWGLAELTIPVVDFMEQKTVIALSGSVLNRNQAVRDGYIRLMKQRYPAFFGTSKGVLIKSAEYGSDYGAMLLALKSIREKQL